MYHREVCNIILEVDLCLGDKVSKIFISYARKDESFVRNLADNLASMSIDSWVDVNDIPAGEKWSSAIQQALNVCTVTIVVISPHSMDSENVEDEWHFFQDKKKPIIPILIEKTNNIHYQLSRKQHIDFIQQSFEVAFTKLLDELKRHGISLQHSQENVSGRKISPYASKLAKDIGIDISQVTPTGSAGTQIIREDIERYIGDYIAPSLKEILPNPFDWCFIPAGVVDAHYPVKNFWIAKYPTTNSQYRVFLEASNGYDQTSWWSYSSYAQDWRNRSHHKPEVADDNLPVNVTWYDAIAFCKWLEFKIGGLITLPEQYHWQRAAQGVNDDYVYTWGKQPIEGYANTKEALISSKTSVLQFYKGKSPYGVVDMCGNVWEWCLNEVGLRRIDMKTDNPRATKGGSYQHGLTFASVKYTGEANPDHKSIDIGFRIVCNIPE
jgi:hypothetical protein